MFVSIPHPKPIDEKRVRAWAPDEIDFHFKLITREMTLMPRKTQRLFSCVFVTYTHLHTYLSVHVFGHLQRRVNVSWGWLGRFKLFY